MGCSAIRIETNRPQNSSTLDPYPHSPFPLQSANAYIASAYSAGDVTIVVVLSKTNTVVVVTVGVGGGGHREERVVVTTKVMTGAWAAAAAAGTPGAHRGQNKNYLDSRPTGSEILTARRTREVRPRTSLPGSEGGEGGLVLRRHRSGSPGVGEEGGKDEKRRDGVLVVVGGGTPGKRKRKQKDFSK